MANNDQLDNELNQTDYVARSHGGPKADGIGDACDLSPNTADGQYFTVLNLAANCIGGTDFDNDGWCTASLPGTPADPDDNNASRTPEDYDIVQPMYVAHAGSGPAPWQQHILLMRQPWQVCSDGIDNDGDTLVDNLDQGAGANTCRPKGLPAYPVGLCGGNNTPALNGGLGCQGDADGDGYTDEAEILIGTDPLGRCQVGTTAPSNAWPSDFTSGGTPLSTDKITITDITSFVAPAPKKNNTNPGDAGFNVRWDLVPGPGVFATWINTNDITALIAGASGYPPMFGGTTKAKDGPACTNHPNFGN
ncbi:MAG: hypothetical protein E6J42_01280 [Chloroflexi bacterium]|nr:MAG: hypothetical protein E6J42_01280 [Chloroflexota bacterium]